MDLQGIITFSGAAMEAIVETSFTLTHGVTPSSAVIHIAPQTKPIPEVGELVLSYGPIKIVFPDCRAQALNIEIHGTTVWAITIMDHRWRWRFGEISGEYNVRDADGKLIPDSVKSVQDLAKLLFEAMGETKADVSKLPTNQYPERKWEIAKPAEELATLCEEFGFRVVMGSKNKVTICKQGEGALLPNKPTIESIQQLLELPDTPDVIILRPGRSQFQRILRLVPVAAESNGKIVPLNKVSYTPPPDPTKPWTAKYPWGWFNKSFADAVFPPATDDKKHQKRKEHRDLATKWVFRGYRVYLQDADEPLSIAGEVIEDLDRILPMNTFQLRKTGAIIIPGRAADPFAASDRKQGEPAIVYGRWNIDSTGTNLDVWRNRPAAQILAEQADIALRPDPTGDYLLHPGERYTKAYTFDADRGIVMFAEPTYEVFHNDAFGGAIKVPALLYLVTSFGLRDKKTRAWRHESIERKLPGKKYGTKPKHIYRSDITYREWVDNLAGFVLKNNKPEVDLYAKHYLDAEVARLQLKAPASADYIGYEPIEPDGAITQITWITSASGEARTRASRNREEADVARTFAEKRQDEQLAAFFGKNNAAREKDKGKFGE